MDGNEGLIKHLKKMNSKQLEELCRGGRLNTEDLISALAEVYGENRKELVSKIREVERFSVRKEAIKTIGIFYYKMAQGGVQRVISLLLPMYLKMGYQVVLFTDEQDLEKEYSIPEQVVRVLLPAAMTTEFGNYKVRAKAMGEAIEKYHIDVMLYHAAECRMLVYDMLLVKAYGVPFCLTVHGLFSAEMLRQSYFIDEKLVTFQMVDCLIVLSKMEETFWRTFGVKAVYIPNPIQELPYSDSDGEYILWLGRFETTQKQYLQAMEIMQRVVKVLPDAKLKMVGSEVTKGAKATLRKRVKKLHLEKNVEVCDFTLNVAEYYKNAKIFLVTSSWEAFPMTIVESKGYGIPLVTYDMPYLEVLKSGEGYVNVPQDDIEGAAEAIVKLWTDSRLRESMKREARHSYEMLQNTDLQEAWKSVLDDVLRSKSELIKCNKEDIYMKQVLSTMLSHYKKGCEQNGVQSDYPIVRVFAKLSRMYIVLRENGLSATWQIIKTKMGSK